MCQKASTFSYTKLSPNMSHMSFLSFLSPQLVSKHIPHDHLAQIPFCFRTWCLYCHSKLFLHVFHTSSIYVIRRHNTRFNYSAISCHCNCVALLGSTLALVFLLGQCKARPFNFDAVCFLFLVKLETLCSSFYAKYTIYIH